MFGIDAVHGNGNIVGATLFPHNSALGATRDPELIRRIGIATAQETAVSGFDWAFGPTLTVLDYAAVAVFGASGALAKMPVRGRITLSGYEGSELLVGRLLVESGADLRYVGSACPATPWNQADREWLEAKGVHVQFRASLEQDIAALHEWQPDVAIGTTPVVQAAKELSIPGLYFTNLISARPLMGPAGAGSLATVINAAIGNKARFQQMKDFFGETGAGHAAGVGHDQAVEAQLAAQQAEVEVRRHAGRPAQLEPLLATRARVGRQRDVGRHHRHHARIDQAAVDAAETRVPVVQLERLAGAQAQPRVLSRRIARLP